jgi:NAD-dependent SIR2 family protein deacetylase
MSMYEDLVIQTQGNYERYYNVYARGGTPYKLAEPTKLTHDQQIQRLVDEIAQADCVLVGGASGLSAAGGGDFYYGDTPSFREHFGKFADKYGIQGAFAGTFRHTTLNAPVRAPYRDLDALLAGKDFFVLTTNQDTQFIKLYPEQKVAEIQGDHRFFQCARCCTDDVWDAVEPVERMVEAMGDGTSVPDELIPRCPHCGGEAFPWVRGYGNFLQGKRYEAEYEKVSQYLRDHQEQRILFLELGVGRMTPMFIQEPFWNLAAGLPRGRYLSVNDRYDFMPEQLGEKDNGLVIVGDIAQVLHEARQRAEGVGDAAGASDGEQAHAAQA